MVTIYPKAPYDFAKSVNRLQGVQHELYQFEEDHLARTIRVNGKVYLVRISNRGTVDQPVLYVEAEGGPTSQADLEAVQCHVARMFTAEMNLEELYSHMSKDQCLVPLVEQYRGLRLILESDPFECMIKTIIGQQLNLAFAATLNKRIIERASEPYIAKNGKIYPVFPTADQVAQLSYEDLRALQFSQRKAEYVIDFARMVADGKLDLDALRKMEDDDIMEKLVKIRGIGRWTVECFLLFGLGRRDLLPAADIGLRNAVRKLYGLDYQPKEDEVRAIGAAWSPWSSYITFYLWESLNQAT